MTGLPGRGKEQWHSPPRSPGVGRPQTGRARTCLPAADDAGAPATDGSRVRPSWSGRAGSPCHPARDAVEEVTVVAFLEVLRRRPRRTLACASVWSVDPADHVVRGVGGGAVDHLGARRPRFCSTLGHLGQLGDAVAGLRLGGLVLVQAVAAQAELQTGRRRERRRSRRRCPWESASARRRRRRLRRRTADAHGRRGGDVSARRGRPRSRREPGRRSRPARAGRSGGAACGRRRWPEGRLVGQNG